MCAWFSAPSKRRRGAARLAAATLMSGLAAAGVMTAAGPAAADTAPQGQGGATATIGGLKTYGTAVIHDGDGGGDFEVSAGLFEMSVDGGGMLQTYCVDVHTPTQKDAKYHETPWSGTSLGTNKDAGKIRWILQHSYPQVNDLAALAAKAGVSSLTEQDAAAGTQVAVWRYSDGADVDAVDPEAEKLADYLHAHARDLTEPRASLTLDPPAVSGHPGERIGPVTVRTDASSVTVTPPANAATTGIRITGADGRPITSAVNGSRLFFEVPQDAAGGDQVPGGGVGTATLTVQASTTVPVGRAFTSDSRSQTQILAGSSESTVSATADATWAAHGAIPALSASKNCAESGVDITVVNKGDESFTFELLGTGHSIAAGASGSVTIPLQEDQAYDFTIEDPSGVGRRFSGVLDCRTQGREDGAATQTVVEPSPATVGGSAAGGTNLAATGGTSTTPLMAAIGLSLLVLGATALSIVRKKKAPAER